MKRILLPLASIAFVVVACSSSSSGGGAQTGSDAGSNDSGSPQSDSGSPDGDSGTPQGDGAATGCTYAVTGAMTASGTCSVQAVYAPADMKVNVTLTSPGPVLTFAASITNQSTFAAGTYTLTQAPAAGGEFTPDTTSPWTMCNDNACKDGKGNSIPNQGTFTLTITDTGPAEPGMLWMAPHGTLTMTLPAVPSTTASGTVTANVTF
jgi:hypothetical protein